MLPSPANIFLRNTPCATVTTTWRKLRQRWDDNYGRKACCTELRLTIVLPDDHCLEDEAVGETVEDAAGTGAPLPAVSEPNPSLLSDPASIFPVGLKPFLS